MDLGSELTVCICTRDRPDDLAAAIESVLDRIPSASVVVSEDGEQSTAPIVERFPRCRWQQGPARGLGANRNAAVRPVETRWLLFLDDDARIGAEFLSSMEGCLAGLDPQLRQRTIVTGRESKDGVLISPHDVDFLGFQRRDYAPGGPRHTVVINATVWPRELFDRVSFDERLLYGYDEVDISYSALAAGYRIEECPGAINDHEPSPLGRDDYPLNVHASRLRVMFKRYWRLQRRYPQAMAFSVAAPLHLLLSLLRLEGIRGVGSFISVMRRSLRNP